MMTRSWPNGRRASCGAGDSATGSVPGSHWMMRTLGRIRARDMSTGAAPVQAAFSRLGRAVGHLVGGPGLPRSAADRDLRAGGSGATREELKRDWNRLVERAAEEGVHVIHTDGYDHLHKELDTVSKNMLLDRGVESEISTVLAQIGKVVSNRNYFDSCREYMAGQMDRREALEVARRPSGAWRFPAMGTTTHGGT